MNGSAGRTVNFRVEYLRAGHGSWWSRASSVARHMGLGHAASGTWIVFLLIALMITIAQKAGADGRLFGSVTTKDIEVAIKAQGLAVDRKRIQLAEPIKSLGTYQIQVKLVSDVTATLKVEVVAR